MFSKQLIRDVVKENAKILASTNQGLAIKTMDGGLIHVGSEFYYRSTYKGLHNWDCDSKLRKGDCCKLKLEEIQITKKSSSEFSSSEGNDTCSVSYWVNFKASAVMEMAGENNDEPTWFIHRVNRIGKYYRERIWPEFDSHLKMIEAERNLHIGCGEFFVQKEYIQSFLLADGHLAKIGDEIWMWRNTAPYPALVCKTIVDVVWQNNKLIPICSYPETLYSRKETVPLFSSQDSACHFYPERAKRMEHAYIRTGMLRERKKAA